MNIILNNSEFELVEKKSKFIARSFCVLSEKNALVIIKDISYKYRDATHNVYAYRIMENSILKLKFFDAAEPKNRAGKPIADLLNKLELINTLIIVTRYFGGIKLGGPGLSRAYQNSAKNVIMQSGIEQYIPTYNAKITFSYDLISHINNLLEGRKHTKIISKSFTDKVLYQLVADEETLELLHKQNNVAFL